jgi:uncharacterized cofD-like protein
MMAPTAGLSKAIAILLLGVVCFVLGSALSFKEAIAPLLDSVRGAAQHLLKWLFPVGDLDIPTHFLGGVLLMTSMLLLFLGLRAGLQRLVETIDPDFKANVGDIYIRRQRLAQGPHIVAIGGGTGLSTLLRGLKQHTSNITAIVTVTDDGGSSGRLKQEKGMIPPGDIRNCLVALADAEKSMTDLFQHRFKKDSGSLSGHAMGNLLIAALVDQAAGDFEKAIEIASDVLNIRGRVVPSTLDTVSLRAILGDGSEICGETAIVEAGKGIRRIFLEPATVSPNPAIIEAIKDADLICIGPGSVYTSVIPNFLIPGVAQAVREASCPKVYVCNVMTQKGESDSFTASEHVTAVQVNVQSRIFDYVMVNTGIPSEAALEKYRDSGQFYVEADYDRIRAMGFKTITGNFMNEGDVVRHDPMRLAARLVKMVMR